MTLQVQDVFVARQFAVAHYTDGSDGYPAALVRDVVIALADGRHFALPAIRWPTREQALELEECGHHPFPAYHDADKVAARVRAAGRIRPELWVEVETDERSLEEKWADDAEREALERLHGAAV